MALPKERIGISVDGTFESDDGRWAVVSLAGGPHCNRPEAGDAAGRKDSKADFELFASRGSGRRLGRELSSQHWC